MRKVMFSIGAFLAIPVAFAQVPAIFTSGTVNAADYSRAVAPGALISVFGNNLSTGSDQARGLPLPLTLAGASVELIDGARTVSAPLYYVSPGQINAQLPYDLAGSSVQVRVRTAAGVSNTDTLSLQPRAPRFFTWSAAGQGRAVLTHANYHVAQRSDPAKPGEVVLLYMNSLGAVDPAVAAGTAPGDGTANAPLNRVREQVDVTVNGNPSPRVDYAGLAPGFPGLYQVNFLMPFDTYAGDLDVVVRAGQGQAQSNVQIPVEPNGFYFVQLGGKIPDGQSMNAANGALAWRQNAAATWGTRGLRSWTSDLGLPQNLSAAAGLALTLKNGSLTVFDNNGIEDGTHNRFYDNTNRGPDDNWPGLYQVYSMSTYLDSVWTGYFKLTAPVTVTQIIGYFDGNGQSELPFDPASMYNRYRMNIWSSAGRLPKETGNFTGDAFSSDRVRGQFAFSDTGVRKVYRNGATDPIFRLVYTLEQPVTLPAGEYWFGHDVAVPGSSTAGPAAVRPSALISAAR